MTTDERLKRIEKFLGFDLHHPLSVVDPDTNLEWLVADGLPKLVDWGGACEYVETLNATDHNNWEKWRLPTLSELLTLMDETKYETPLQIVDDAYWTRTPYPGKEGYMWFVSTCGAEGSQISNACSVRCVRGGQHGRE